MLLGGPRSALRRHRKVVIALSVITGLALSGFGLESASASTRSRLAVSFKSDRSSSVRLAGSTVKGKVYIFVRNSKTLDKVDFYLDSSRRTKPPVRTDTDPPFDFAGTAADGTALPYDTSKLTDGSHSIRVVLTWSNGTTSSRRGNFAVDNKGTTTTPTTAPTTPAAEPTPTTTTTAPAPPATTTAPPPPTTTSAAPPTNSAPTTTAPPPPSTTTLPAPNSS
jgi:hypothetical protein